MVSSYQRNISNNDTVELEPMERPRKERKVPSIRRIFGIVFLSAGIAFLLVSTISSIPHGSPFRMETIPIEMEGRTLKLNEESTSLEEGCEATIILMRHCEKGNLKKHCDYMGLERSVYLASLFGDHGERYPTPSYIFAESPDGRHNSLKRNYREVETAGPLSQKTGVDVDASYNTETVKELISHLATLLKHGELCGKVVVIVWKHSSIARLARKLGCGHDQGCPDEYRGKTFDQIWQLRFVYDFRVGPDVEYHHHKTPKLWQVFGYVQQENFDPLEFSNRQRDFPVGGRMGPPHWLSKADVLAEERVTSTGDNWDKVKPDFVA